MSQIDKYIMETNDPSMTYNSQRDDLRIPEYGRHVQKMIQYAKTVEKQEHRQQLIEQVINLMEIMHPQNRGFEDYRVKLWKHVFEIADYELEGVVPPSGEVPTPERRGLHPEQVPYPTSESRYRHYGHNIQVLINKAVGMEEGPVREGFERCIANYMKLAYQTWNREHYVSDEFIIDDLTAISDGKIELEEGTELAKVARSSIPSGGKGRGRRRNSSGRSNSSRSKRYSKRRKK